jgi:hypothetical protein
MRQKWAVNVGLSNLHHAICTCPGNAGDLQHDLSDNFFLDKPLK